ncbi:MAG: uroporphyrinogen-III synthase, partial [Verrucomicrobiota bacterium]
PDPQVYPEIHPNYLATQLDQDTAVAGMRVTRQLVETKALAKHIQPVLPEGTEFEVVEIETIGDKDQTTALTDPAVPDDFFTRDIDDALLNSTADLSMHSAKDLPDTLREGLTIAALLPAKDIRDALVLRKDLNPDEAPNVIGTSSPRRTEWIKTLFPQAELAPIRGAIQNRLEQLDAGKFDAVIIAACALDRLGLSDRIGHYLPYDPTPQQGRLALVAPDDQAELIEQLRPLDVRRNAGLVAIVGCPADISFMSERARQYLKHGDVVFHDRLLPDELLLSIQGKAIPVGKAGGHKSTEQADIHRLILNEAEKGRLVVRLHGGDPCIFGHLSEELEFLTDWNLRVDVVTTPSAAQIVSSHALAPLTHRGDGGSINFITAYTAKDTPADLPGPEHGNLAIYMGVRSREQIQTDLLAQGWSSDTSIVIGQRIGYRDEAIRQSTLERLKDEAVESPAVFIIGGNRFPVDGWTLFVGTDPENFLNHGPILHWPLIKLVSRPLDERRRRLEEQIEKIDGIIFPSRHAVRCFVEALMDWKDTRALAEKKILAIGPATAHELAGFGLKADEGANNYGGVQALSETIGDRFQGRYLYPCSDASPQQERIDAVKEHGIELVPSCFYMNRKIPFTAFPRLPIARVLFTSTSSVNYYFELYPDELKADRAWLAVGPSTLKALKGHGLKAGRL